MGWQKMNGCGGFEPGSRLPGYGGRGPGPGWSSIMLDWPPPGGVEPPTFRLTAERANHCATEALLWSVVVVMHANG
jgi:hypothetical protein